MQESSHRTPSGTETKKRLSSHALHFYLLVCLSFCLTYLCLPVRQPLCLSCLFTYLPTPICPAVCLPTRYVPAHPFLRPSAVLPCLPVCQPACHPASVSVGLSCLSGSLFTNPPACQSCPLYLPVPLLVLAVQLPARLPVCPSLYPYVCPPTCLPVFLRLPANLYVCLLACLPVNRCACLSVRLSLNLSI